MKTTERIRYWINLKGQGESHPTKRVLEVYWDKGRTKKFCFGKTGKAAARELGVHNTEFCPTVVRPVMDDGDSSGPEAT